MPTFPKPSRVERRLAQFERRLKAEHNERSAKIQARARDGHRCRFPLCGCRKLKLRLEVSHQQHKGMGGNPSGDRSTTAGLITLCVQRHQDGIISRHHGTMRVRALTEKGMDGPVAFDLDNIALLLAAKELGRCVLRGQWSEAARESAVQTLEPLSPWQESILKILAEMKL